MLLNKIKPFFDKYEPLYYKKGQIVIRPEDETENIYLIEKGFVRFYSISKDGKEMTFLIYKPGYIFPVFYALLGKNKYYFEALTPLVLRKAPRHVFTEYISEDIEALFLCSKEIVIRFEELLNRMELLAFGNAFENVASIILFCAEQLGTRKGNNSVHIDLPIGHKEIASMVGAARETVSVEMKKLENDGLIEYRRGYIRIRNIERFKKETELSS